MTHAHRRRLAVNRRRQGRLAHLRPYADQVERGDNTVCVGETVDGTKVSVLVTFTSDRMPVGSALMMNTMAVAVVLIVALAASGIGTGLAVLLSR